MNKINHRRWGKKNYSRYGKKQSALPPEFYNNGLLYLLCNFIFFLTFYFALRESR